MRRGVREAETGFAAAVEAREYVLHHPKRTDYGAIDAAEEQGEHCEANEDAYVERHGGREELYARHPPEPRMERAGKIEQQGCDAQEEQSRQSDTYFFQHCYKSFRFAGHGTHASPLTCKVNKYAFNGLPGATLIKLFLDIFKRLRRPFSGCREVRQSGHRGRQKGEYLKFFCASELIQINYSAFFVKIFARM